VLPAQATDTGTDGDSWVYRADAEVNFTSDLICKDRHYPMVDYAQPQIRSMKHAILTGTKSAVLNPFYFGYLMAEAISGAGLPDDCVLQGLRKSAAVKS
jgi:hypothetical protein